MRWIALVVLSPSLLLACGGWQLGAGNWGPIAVDGVYICFGEKPIDPANCSPATVHACSSNGSSKTVVVESYLSFGDERRRVVTVQVPAYAAVPPGDAPFLGFSEDKQLTGICAVRQYLIRSVK